MTDRAPRAPLTLPFTVPRPDHWTTDAACAKPDVEAEWWNGVEPGEGEPTRKARQAQALAICAECPALVRCRAETQPGDSGVRGGLVLREHNRNTGRPQVGGRKPAEIEHGSASGARTHWRRGEVACRPCLDAETRARADRSAKRRKAS